MKKHLFSPVLTCLALIVLWAQPAVGQNSQPGSTVKAQSTTPAAANQLPYCDQVIGPARASLQKQADANCQTQQRCVPCTERQSNTEVYATLVVQPQQAGCKTVKAEPIQAEPFEADKSVNVAISQSACPKSGVGLEVTFPDPLVSAADCTFEWEVDGKPAGRAAKLDCACGKTARIKVTRKSTGRTVTRTLLLPEACPQGMPNNKQ